MKRNNSEDEENETMSVITFDGIGNNNKNNANDTAWRWATVHRNKINDSPPKRRRRHRRSNNNVDFTTEILPNLQETIDTTVFVSEK